MISDYDTTCSDLHEYICELQFDFTTVAPTTVAPTTIDSGLCPSGWIPNGSKCYKVSTTTATWSDARANCAAANGASDLVVINDATEYAYVSSIV